MAKVKKYLVLDCETCTVQERNDYTYSQEEKNRIGIALPVIYDLAWLIVDRNGKVYEEKSIIIRETFFNEDMFNTGYYANKRHIYMKGIQNGDFEIMTFNEALATLEESCQNVDFVCAYNCNFDFKKAIPFTRRYLNGTYTQKRIHNLMDDIAKGRDNANKRPDWLDPIALVGDTVFPLFDIWEIAVDRLCGKKYKKFCKDNDFCTASGKYYKTSAETVYAYLTNDPDYEEKHTALEDCYIEAYILQKAIAKKAIKKPLAKITPFVFRKLGNYEEGDC